MTSREPEHVGIDKKEEDHKDRQQIHIEHEQDSGMVEIPARMADAAIRISAAGKCDDSGDKDQQGWLGVGEAGEEICGPETEEDENTAAQGGRYSRIEDAGSHSVRKVAVYKDRP
jgi:hypothetical protein